MAALPGPMDFAEPCQQTGVGSGERCPAPIRRDSVAAAGLAPKTIVNVVTVVKFVVASAVDEEGDQSIPEFGTTNSCSCPWSSRRSRIVPRSRKQKYPPC